MKVSLCVTCMGRLEHLTRTLLRNLVDNPGADIEFVLLNYNSPDDLDRWARENLGQAVRSGRLVYIHERTARMFHQAHAKNVAHRAASGEILCNLDADNWTGPGFGQLVQGLAARAFGGFRRGATKIDNPALSGRLAFRRTEFRALGGYNEQLKGHGWEDMDLLARALKAGMVQADYPAEFEIDPIVHETDKAEKDKGSGNRELSMANLAKGMITANRPGEWGRARVLKNWEEEIELPVPDFA